MIAALFVESNGPYFGLPNVDPWDEARDARKYKGPYPVIAHPPCERWGRYWSGGPSAKVKRKKGDDNGCFVSAFASVRYYGGILEHPEASHAWTHFGLLKPNPHGGCTVIQQEKKRGCLFLKITNRWNLNGVQVKAEGLMRGFTHKKNANELAMRERSRSND